MLRKDSMTQSNFHYGNFVCACDSGGVRTHHGSEAGQQAHSNGMGTEAGQGSERSDPAPSDILPPARPVHPQTPPGVLSSASVRDISCEKLLPPLYCCGWEQYILQVYLGLRLPRLGSTMAGTAGGRQAGQSWLRAESSHLEPQQGAELTNTVWTQLAFEASKPPPSDIIPPTRSYLLNLPSLEALDLRGTFYSDHRSTISRLFQILSNRKPGRNSVLPVCQRRSGCNAGNWREANTPACGREPAPGPQFCTDLSLQWPQRTIYVEILRLPGCISTDLRFKPGSWVGSQIHGHLHRRFYQSLGWPTG